MAFAYDIYTNPSKNNGVLRPTLAALIETPLQEPRGSAIREYGRDIVSHVPFFSREAAFLLDAMAALPRKSDPMASGS